jgi:hypothetical protein
MPLARLAEVADFVDDLVKSSSVVSFDLPMLINRSCAILSAALLAIAPYRAIGLVL